MQQSKEEIDRFRHQVQRILDSPEFAGSPRVIKFFSFVCEAAFQGKSNLDQCEIATHVFESKKDFHPLDDASIRKLASLTRHKLEKYYIGSGANDAAIVTLPLRSYVPRFRVRDEACELDVLVPLYSKHKPPAWPFRWRRISIAVALVGVFAVISLYIVSWPGRPQTPDRFELTTRRGDIMHELFEVSTGAIQLGPRVGQFGDVCARLHFTPDKAVQQAGILMFESPDLYVKLGRQFNTRTVLEFGIENHGRYRKTPSTFEYDFAGQTGAPVWLSIRRDGNQFRAFLSTNGLAWRQFGEVLETEQPMENARLGIFAFSGPTNAPSISAVFDRLSYGVNFHHLNIGANGSEILGLQTTFSGEPGRVTELENMIEVTLPSTRRRSNWSLKQSVPAGDWTISTLIDFLSVTGSFAGIEVQGMTGSLRLIRWSLNGGSVTMERSQHTQVSKPDYPGSPPIVLKLSCQSGMVTGSYSRDFQTFEQVPLAVPLKALGEGLQVGLVAGRSSWSTEETLPPARFLYFRRTIERLAHYQGGTNRR